MTDDMIFLINCFTEVEADDYRVTEVYISPRIRRAISKEFLLAVAGSPVLTGSYGEVGFLWGARVFVDGSKNGRYMRIWGMSRNGEKEIVREFPPGAGSIIAPKKPRTRYDILRSK